MRGNPEEKERMKGIVEKRIFFSVVFFIPFYFKSIFCAKSTCYQIRSGIVTFTPTHNATQFIISVKQ